MLETACEYIKELNGISTEFSELKLSKQLLGMLTAFIIFLFRSLMCLLHNGITILYIRINGSMAHYISLWETWYKVSSRLSIGIARLSFRCATMCS